MATAISQVQRWHLVPPGSREAAISCQMVPFFALNVQFAFKALAENWCPATVEVATSLIRLYRC